MRNPHRIRKPQAVPVLLVLLMPLLASCTARVFVQCPPGLEEPGRNLQARLFEGLGPERLGPRLREAESPEKADIVLDLESFWTLRNPPHRDGRSVVELALFAPTRAVGMPASPGGTPQAQRAEVFEAALADCLSGTASLSALDAVRPPRVALAVDGKTADDPDYPLWRAVEAVPEVRSPPGRRAEARVREVLAALDGEARAAAARTVPGILWIAAAGDLITGRGIDRRLINRGGEGVLDAGILRILSGADLAVANLEGALTSGGRAARKTYTFRSPPATAAALAGTGLDAVLLANNHSLDWGTEGLADTLAALESEGLASAGAGRNLEEAAKPALFLRKGMTVAVFGAARFPREKNGWDGSGAAAGAGKPGIFWLDDAGTARLESAFRDDVLDVVLFHGGREWSDSPDGETRDLLQSLAAAGADVIFGSHPHVVQGMEWMEGRPVFWSLGNFVFPGMDGTPGGERGLVVLAGFYGTRLLYLRTFPIDLSREGSRLAPRR